MREEYRTKFVMAAGGLVARGDTVELRTGKLLFIPFHEPWIVREILSTRIILEHATTGEVASFERGNFVVSVKSNMKAFERMAMETAELVRKRY